MRYASGKRAKLPFDAQVHLVAARYGQTPESVREWPADDFLAALNYIGITRG